MDKCNAKKILELVPIGVWFIEEFLLLILNTYKIS